MERIANVVVASIAGQHRIIDQPAAAPATRAWVQLGILAPKKIV